MRKKILHSNFGWSARIPLISSCHQLPAFNYKLFCGSYNELGLYLEGLDESGWHLGTGVLIQTGSIFLRFISYISPEVGIYRGFYQDLFKLSLRMCRLIQSLIEQSWTMWTNYRKTIPTFQKLISPSQGVKIRGKGCQFWGSDSTGGDS